MRREQSWRLERAVYRAASGRRAESGEDGIVRFEDKYHREKDEKQGHAICGATHTSRRGFHGGNM